MRNKTPITMHYYLVLLIAVVGVSCAFPRNAAGATGRCKEWTAKIVSIEGRVEAQLAGDTRWRAAQLNDTYCPDDKVRTLENSRAAIQLQSETVLRLDQNTMVQFSAVAPEHPTLLELIRGSAFFTTRYPHPLTIETPYVNATSGGTEYHIEVNEQDQSATVTVIEGQMNVTNQQGSVTVKGGQAAVTRAGQPPVVRIPVRPRDAIHWVLYYPPVLSLGDLHLGDLKGLPPSDWRVMVQKSIRAYRGGNIAGAFAAIKGAPVDIPDARFYAYRASLLLSVGQVDAAKADIDRAYDLAPRGGLALALQSIVAVAQGEPAKALKLASDAAEAQPDAVSVQIALSYADQANFDLPRALAAARQATKLDAKAALAWARVAELWLAQGDLDRALSAAKQAEVLNPREARIQTVLGFAYLTQLKISQAKAAFDKAISLNSSDPLPRLGLGLATIRTGDLAGGRKVIEIAVTLDPGNALIRSYLGKAYYEEKRDHRAETQFKLAEQIDPKDPTPYLYDAIREQSINRPVQALHDLQQSIALNNNRAPYRSRLLLDDDLAVRSVNQGLIYDDLGFGQLALVEAFKSVNIDPANYSALRFLANSYAVIPNSQFAQLSSLLQSQLLQPLNTNPIQPRLNDIAPAILAGAGQVSAAYNEYSQLFTRDGVKVLASGVAGGDNTLGQEVIASGLEGRYAYSIGESRYKTDGYRPNADISDTNYDAFSQVALTDRASIQAEYRYNLTKNGDIALRLDPQDFSLTQRRKKETNTARIGFHYHFSPRSDTIATVFYQDQKEDFQASDSLFKVKQISWDNAYGGEAQQLYHGERFDITAGVGHFEGEEADNIVFFGIPFPPSKTTDRYTNAYVYSLIHLPRDATLTVGESIDAFQGTPRNRSQFNPKVGLLWNVTPSTTLRLAYFRTLTRPLVSDQTIEPSQVAGFQQLFNDPDTSQSTRYGIGVDQRFAPRLFGGMEFSKREVKVPFFSTVSCFCELVADSDEHQGRAYLAWTPHPWLAARAEYQYQWLRQDRDLFSNISPNITTQRIPLGLNFYHPSGLFAKWTETYIHQTVEYFDNTSVSDISGGDNFWLADIAIGYRLPRRWGMVTLEVNNLFDKNFRYHDYQGLQERYPTLLPERVVYARLTLSY